MIEKKEFGDWAVVFWNKGSRTLHIAQNQGDLGTTNYWMVGTTTRQFDYECGWLPNKEWTSAIKGHFSKEKAIQLAKEKCEKDHKNNLKEEFLDFCRYGQCLEEETAKEYLKFLVDAISKVERNYGEKATTNPETHIKINNNRFEKEVDRLGQRAEDDFFEGKTLGEFESEFEKMFNQLKTQHNDKDERKISSKWIEWVQDSFNNYVARFEKRNPSTRTDFRDQVSWKNKKKTSNSGKYLPSDSKK